MLLERVRPMFPLPSTSQTESCPADMLFADYMELWLEVVPQFIVRRPPFPLTRRW